MVIDSVDVNPIPMWELKDIEVFLQTISIPNKRENDRILVNLNVKDRPVIKEIHLSEPTSNLFQILNTVGHARNSIGGRESDLKKAIGSVGPRFASPLWVKVLHRDGRYRAMITVLNNTKHNHDQTLTEMYIEHVLKNLSEENLEVSPCR